MLYDRFGSKSDFARRPGHFRLCPSNGHRSARSEHIRSTPEEVGLCDAGVIKFEPLQMGHSYVATMLL